MCTKDQTDGIAKIHNIIQLKNEMNSEGWRASSVGNKAR